MNRILGLAAAAIFFLCGQANAAVVTFQYSGIVDYTAMENAEGFRFGLADFDGFKVVNGNTVQGRFTYNTANPMRPGLRYYGVDFYDGVPGTGGSSIDVIENGLSFRSTSADAFHMSVGNDNPGFGFIADYFGIASLTLAPDGQPFQTLSFFVSDKTGTAFSSKQLPTELNLSDFQNRGFTFGYSRKDSWAQFQGKITTLERISVVPEPATPMLLLAGFGLLAGLRRYAKPKSAPMAAIAN